MVQPVIDKATRYNVDGLEGCGDYRDRGCRMKGSVKINSHGSSLDLAGLTDLLSTRVGR